MLDRDIAIRLVSCSVVLAAAAALGCGPREVTHTYQDRGALCAYPASETSGNPTSGGAQSFTYTPGEPVQIAVAFAACLSGSCSREIMATCNVDAAGTALQVTSEGSFVDIVDANTCTTDCRSFIARCTTPPLDAGTYTIQHGADSLALTIPSSGPPPCVGRPPWPAHVGD